jgi:predicted CXXCH cytochrome family protein
MKYKRRPKLFRVAVVAIGAIAWGIVSAGVVDTVHNLGTTGGAATPADTFSGTAEICVFCHTPHGSDTTAAVPLWNKSLPLASSFQTYNSVAASATSSLDGEVVDVGSVSIACLSCHDGVQAMDSIINAPGSTLAGNAAWQAGTWTGDGIVNTGVANIGKDLTNDHPVGIQYGGGGLSTSTPNGTLKDADFETTLTDTLNGTVVWWVETGGNTTREKTDMQLYTRIAGSAEALPQPFVECASCHDPHSSTNDTFLRISNAGSAVCLACHTK